MGEREDAPCKLHRPWKRSAYRSAAYQEEPGKVILYMQDDIIIVKWLTIILILIECLNSWQM